MRITEQRLASLERPSLRVAAAWAVLGLLMAGQLAVADRPGGLAVPSASAVAWYLAWLLWIPITPLVLRLARRQPLEPGGWGRRLPVHLLASGALALGLAASRLGIEGALERAAGGAGPAPGVGGLLPFGLTGDLLVYWGLVALGSALHQHRRARLREARSDRLAAALARAQLGALAAQLHPHFLCNSLHLIASLLKEDAEKAERMTMSLADLLRRALESSATAEVPLREEIEFLESYLAMARIRFEDRLEVRIDAPPETLDALVPSLILQPLVENAVHHGIAGAGGRGAIEVSASRVGRSLRLEVCDTGPGPSREVGGRVHPGIGLANVRRRLAGLYGSAQRFRLTARPGGGAMASIEIPFRRRGAAAALSGPWPDPAAEERHGHPDLDRRRRAAGP